MSIGAYFGFGQPRADYVIQLAALMGTALVATSTLVVLVGTLILARAWRRAERNPIVFEARRGFGYGAWLKIPRGLPLVEFHWTWVTPPETSVTRMREGATWVEEVERPGRGLAETVLRRFVVEDGFGLARIVFHRKVAQTVQVLPWLGALERAPVLRSLSQGDALPHPAGEAVGDRVDMRRYVPGDPLKLAMWKIYARTGQLMVRTPERAVAPSTQVFAYLVSATGDEPSAAAARLAVEAGLLGEDWIFGADGSPGPAKNAESARTLIMASRAVRDTEAGGAAGLSQFLSQAPTSETVKLVLFAPGLPGPWLEYATDAIRRPGVETVVLLGVDGVEEPDATREDRLERWVKRPPTPSTLDEAVVSMDALEEVARTLSGAGAQVLGVDRVQGREVFLGAQGMGAAWRGRAA